MGKIELLGLTVEITKRGCEEEISDYLLNNTDTLIDVTRVLNDDDLLEDLRFYENSEEEINFQFSSPYEFAIATDHNYYDVNDDYFIKLSFGNTISVSKGELIEALKRELPRITKLLIENHNSLYIKDKRLKELLK